MTTKIEKIADKARRGETEIFTSLLHHLTPSLVRKHLYKMKSSTATGVDKESLEGAKATFNTWVKERIQSIHRKGYKAPPVRRVYIPKPGSVKGRPLGVPTIQDRAIQGAVSEILSKIYEVDFLKQSFGGRANLSAHNAIVSLNHVARGGGIRYILNCDLENFFGSVDHGWVMQFLSHRVQDKRLLNLILRWLRAGVIEDGSVSRSTKGVPQGGPISVLLSNIYMHYVLDLWLERIVKPRLKGNMEFVRYLDDFVILLQNEDDLEALSSVMKNRLHKFSLVLNEDKTKTLSFGVNAPNSKHETLDYLGFTLYPTKTARGRYKLGFKTSKSRLHRTMTRLKSLIRKNRHMKVVHQIQQINLLLRGHFNYYGVGNNDDCLFSIRRVAFMSLRKQLCKRSQNGRYTWERYYRLLQFTPLCPVLFKIRYCNFERYQML
jgi:group II intron reverse transcriptase/maturase